MGIPALSPDQLSELAPFGVGFERNTPLWYYVLKEAELSGGTRLVGVGARIVGEVIIGLLALDRQFLLVATRPLAADARKSCRRNVHDGGSADVRRCRSRESWAVDGTEGCWRLSLLPFIACRSRASPDLDDWERQRRAIMTFGERTRFHSLIAAADGGDRSAAEALFTTLYSELHRIARTRARPAPVRRHAGNDQSAPRGLSRISRVARQRRFPTSIDSWCTPRASCAASSSTTCATARRRSVAGNSS